MNHILSLFQMKAFSNNKFISCSYDQTVKVWNADDMKDVIMLKGTLYIKNASIDKYSQTCHLH